MPTRRVQKRLTNDIVLRDRRWGSIFGKALPAQRQVRLLSHARLTAPSVLNTDAEYMHTHRVQH